MFRDAVRTFAEEEVRPRVAAMEQAAQLDATLIPKFFALGLMGIETPEALGGAGGSLFMTVLAVEELSAVDASAAIFVDVDIALRIHRDAMRLLELSGETAGASEAADLPAAFALHDVDRRVVLIDDVDQALLRIG